MLQLETIKKYYGNLLAIEISSMSIEKGLWWLQGKNGSGKTTLLKMITGLLPFSGDITLEQKFSLKKQRQQYVKTVNFAEAEPLYPHFLTAKDLVNLYCYTKGGDINKSNDLLKQLHVYDAYTQPLRSYSSGMIKKVSLTLAFIGQPKIILLDEPLITLDPNAVDTICNIIKDKYQEGVSFIITSPSQYSLINRFLPADLLLKTKPLLIPVYDCYQDIAEGSCQLLL